MREEPGTGVARERFSSTHLQDSFGRYAFGGEGQLGKTRVPTASWRRSSAGSAVGVGLGLRLGVLLVAVEVAHFHVAGGATERTDSLARWRAGIRAVPHSPIR